MKYELNLEKEFKKAKWLHRLKTAGIVIIVLLVLTPFIYAFTQKLSARNSDRLNELLFNEQEISLPNVQIDSQVIAHSSLFGGEVVSNRSKNINGYTVPWVTIRAPYNWLGGSIDQNDQYNEFYHDEKNFYEYNRQTKQKAMSFFSPHVKTYEFGVPNELKEITTLNNHVIEVGLSFDRPYSIEEIKARIPDDLNLVWYWLDTEKNSEKEFIVSEQELYGFTPNLDGYTGTEQDLLESFLETAEQVGKNEKLEDIIKENKEKDIKNVLLSGIVLTGQTQNFKPLVDKDWIRGASAGVNAEIVPYIQPDK